ncbi:MAG: XdhC family protein [Chloroflexota bacterium]|nr:XdhC family protein [Chloroflexota bacterium]
MQDVFHETARALERGEACVLATVVQTAGSTPQKPGAKLLVREDGSGVGTLGGGCVEGDIWFAAKALLRSGGSTEVREYELTEEIAARDGLICGGTMYFLLDPIREPGEFLGQVQQVEQAYKGGTSVGIATLTVVPSDSALNVGAKLFIQEPGQTQGSLGVEELDQEVLAKARELIPNGKCDYLITNTGFEIFVETYTTPPTLVIMGGGHISKALSVLAQPLGYQIHIVDDRPEFANAERFPGAASTTVADYDIGLNQIPMNANTAIVVATRGHKYDDMAAEAAVLSPAGYVGILGSKRKNLMIYEELFRKGIPEERIRAVRAPVGLDLGGQTPEEIALSIMAEIVAVRLGGSGASLKMDERLFNIAREKGKAVSAGG